MVSRELIALGAKEELARRRFFDYCALMAPSFYMTARRYLVELCDELQDFMASGDDALIINEPPRHGKSRTAQMFAQWLFGRDQTMKIMTGSYNEALSTTFSKGVRNAISEVKAEELRPVFSDVFPGVEIKAGDGAMNLWSLTDGYNNYLATSPNGTATGFGADLEIIDDLIKSAEEAHNALVLEKHWSWFVDTMLSRLESGGKIIIIMTRWHSDDLAGRALRELPSRGMKVRHVNMKALQDDGTMLCPEILSRKDYDLRSQTMGADIAAANYQQEPIDIQGRLYKRFSTYDRRTQSYKKKWSYTDTADTGADFLCSIVWGEREDGKCEVLDVVYTQEPMEATERYVTNQLVNNGVNQARIERNNGGRGFARSIRENVRGRAPVAVEDFFQGANKEARIYSNSYWIEENVLYPADWRLRWPEYYAAMTSYQAEGRNKHDDAPDATTGIAETMTGHNVTVKLYKNGLFG